MRTRFGPLLAASVLITAAARADEVVLVPDSTFKVPGGKLVGQITSETPNAVKIKPTTGAEQDVPVDQIESVTYTGQPASLPLAETREANGALAEALDLYKKAAGEAGNRPYIAQAAQFGQARVLYELSKADPARTDEAIAALDAFVKANRSSRHLGPALEALARLSLNKGQTDRAEQALHGLSAIPWAADRAAVLKARVLAGRGKNDEALQVLDQLVASAPRGSARSDEARLARGELLAAAGQFAEAEKAIREVIADTPPEKADFQAVAHNALGDCLRASGKQKDALFAYLETDILYDQDKEQHARALFQIAQLWRDLKQPARADEVMGRLRQQYPQSPYLTAAPKTP
jgi:tetratricopeptide (TPR) repeat protein